jgi:beta-lactamase class A
MTRFRWPLRPLAALLLLPFLAAAAPPAAEAPAARPAVVAGAVENVYTRPDATSEVDDQVVLGEAVEALEETAGFTKVRCASGSVGWVDSRGLVRDAKASSGTPYEVKSSFANLYRDPSFESSRPVVTAPLASRLDVLRTFEKEKHAWAEVRLPDGRRLFAAAADLAPLADFRAPLPDPAKWIEMAKRFAGAPYAWGGTTPFGFDCSGLVTRVFERHGIRLKRNSAELCFREPKLVAVPFEKLEPGDLLFFGSDEKIDHVAMWIGDGEVIQATSYGVPSTQLSWFDGSDRLKGRFRYARRLASMPGAPRPGRWTEGKRAALEAKLKELAAGSGVRFGIVFKDLGDSTAIRIGESASMHAASTMKTAVLAELLRRLDAGTLKWTDELEVKNEFRSVVDGSTFSVEIEGESEGPMLAKAGGKASIGFLANEMTVRSSNFATNLLLQKVGAEAVQKFLDELGAGTVKVRRGLFDMKAFDKGISNETDAAGMAALMEAVVRSPRLSEASRKLAWETLAGQTFNEEIPAGIPRQAGVVIAHKTGSISTVQHDAAIVRLPDGREYLLVLLADGFKGDEARKGVLAAGRKMSRAVWEAMIAP